MATFSESYEKHAKSVYRFLLALTGEEGMAEEPYKNVIILHAYGGVKLKEIADMYGKTESWARVTYYRARQQIVKEVSG